MKLSVLLGAAVLLVLAAALVLMKLPCPAGTQPNDMRIGHVLVATTCR